jgi:hypothetical protein
MEHRVVSGSITINSSKTMELRVRVCVSVNEFIVLDLSSTITLRSMATSVHRMLSIERCASLVGLVRLNLGLICQTAMLPAFVVVFFF